MSQPSAARHIAVVRGHPDPDPAHLCRALADAYAGAATEAGHDVTVVDLAALDVPLLRSRAEFEGGAVPESLRSAVEALRAADHLVLFFPLWLGGAPALVKAFLEQVMRPGIAFDYVERGMPKRRMAGRSARLVVTMGMPAIAFRLWYLSHGLKAVTRGILGFVGYRPVRTTLFGMVEGVSPARRKRWLERMRRLGRRGR